MDSETTSTLREKCPNAEFFMIPIFLHLEICRSVNLRIQSIYEKVRTKKKLGLWILFIYLFIKIYFVLTI